MNKMKNIFLNDRFILYLIILNTLFIFADGSSSHVEWLRYIDAIFTLFFLLEAIVKVNENGWLTYWQDGWNKFDLVIVICALPSLCGLFIEENAGDTSFVLSLRVLRAFKSFLLFRHVPHMSKILKGIRLAIRSSILVCVAYLVFLVVFSILSFALFADDAPRYFGTPLMSLYSIFRLFTIEGWYEMPDAIAEGSGVAMRIFARLYFSVLLFVGGIMGMSLVNSIFVDAMVSDNNEEVLAKLEKIEKELQRLGKSDCGES